MLQRISGPSQQKRVERAPVKTIELHGSEPAIAVVAECRAKSRYCKQSKDLPQKAKISVIYEVTDDGFIAIHRVDALIHHKKVCFFDRKTERVGAITGQGTSDAPEFVYLAKERLAGLIEAIGRVEDLLAVNHLTHLGPEVFAKRRSG